MPKNNPIAPTVEIELGGKTRNLLIDMNALVSFEEATGKDFSDAFANSGKSAKTIRALLWASMLHEDPKLKIEDVGRWVHPGNLGEIAGAVAKAQVLGMGAPEEVKENPTESQPEA